MRLCLYCISVEGHHGAYLLAAAKEAVRGSWQVIVVVPQRDEARAQVKALRESVGYGNVHLSQY